ncbi:MAG TPA: ABC transporter ATP-binding protein [Terriglobia bacterium]|nr:ABC transporter ATP-binding protein [Terriglobia bacterium]
MSLFSLFENILQPTATPRDPAILDQTPPPTLLAFYWHYARQAKGLLVALFFCGLLVAGLDALIPVFIGKTVSLLTAHDPSRLLQDAWPVLLAMAIVLVVARPIGVALQNLVVNQAVAPSLTNLVRWQSHYHVVRQSWSYFQNDFAGRIANRVMQTGPALRESLVQITGAVWYIIVYGLSALVLLARSDWRLTLPIGIWFVFYIALLRFFVPRLRDRSRAMSEMRSLLTGRVVDSYTNILTVKLFAKPRDEDDFVREAVDQHTTMFRDQTRNNSFFSMMLASLNALLLLATGITGIALWLKGSIDLGILAMTLPLSWQMVNISGWVAFNVTGIFENIGVVLDGMKSIAVPRQMPDRPDAGTLAVTQGAIRFQGVHFGYGTQRGVLHGIDLAIAPGERVGLVGASGAGKSTLVNLLLRFYEIESGKIEIDGQDISRLTQESLRAQIAMVTQDTSLLHRSIRDNIRYGRPSAGEAEILAAADRAQATDFISKLEDWMGRKGFEAHVGERGVKLSGGQRQRIAIARVILKNAPILVLDEATSALDSEIEAAIQEQLDDLMQGRTVIAIAHRLSTIARMDRLIVLDHGRIVESGSHAELLQQGGTYARLWHRQSGGFLDPGEAGSEEKSKAGAAAE